MIGRGGGFCTYGSMVYIETNLLKVLIGQVY